MHRLLLLARCPCQGAFCSGPGAAPPPQGKGARLADGSISACSCSCSVSLCWLRFFRSHGIDGALHNGRHRHAVRRRLRPLHRRQPHLARQARHGQDAPHLPRLRRRRGLRQGPVQPISSCGTCRCRVEKRSGYSICAPSRNLLCTAKSMRRSAHCSTISLLNWEQQRRVIG